MQPTFIKEKLNYPIWLFCFGFILILSVPILPIKPLIELFNHNWRPEMMTAIVLTISLLYVGFINSKAVSFPKISKNEIHFLLIPLIIFICWSGLSFFWAESWRSVFQHTSVWFCYLIFYLFIRLLISRKEGLNTALIFLLGFILIIGVPPIIEYSSFTILGGATTLGMRYSIYAELFNCLIPLLTAFVLKLKGKSYYLGVFSVLVAYLLIISSMSRLELILLVAGLGVLTSVVFLTKQFHKYRKRLVTILSLFIVSLVILHSIPSVLRYFSIYESDNNSSIPITQRLKSNEDTSYSNNIRPFFARISLEMIKSNPLLGIGANNYGQEFRSFRENYATTNPTDKNLALAETEYAARAHNEYLQILAELGIIGGLIFAVFLIGILKLNISLLFKLRNVPLNVVAACLGISIFLISALATSYSFRITQNGLCFFFLLAIAVKGLWKQKAVQKQTIKLNPIALRPVYLSAIVVCLLFASFLSVRVAGKYYSLAAIELENVDDGIQYHERAISLDPENADSRYFYGLHYFINKRYAEAIPKMQESIQQGRTSSPTFSYLATSQILTGDVQSAEKTMEQAVKIYPYSVFARIRYSELLRKNLKSGESEEQFRIASSIDAKQAETWRSFISDGARKSTLKYYSSDNMVMLMDLRPAQAMYAIKQERELLYPEEKLRISSK